MKNIITFLLKSSADPRATSLSVKFALFGAIPYLMQALSLVCDFGNQCYSVDASVFEVAFEALANGLYYLLSLISIFGTLYGLGRKLYRTVVGTNLALKD